MRKLKFTKNYLPHAEGSCLIEMGETKVLCVASIEEKVPSFVEQKNKAAGKTSGWLTAEYAMMPRSGNERSQRVKLITGGRSQEISRLIGRALRACVDFEKLGNRTITIDCDVIRADGGTRCAAINGAFVALSLAVKTLLKQKLISQNPIKFCVGAVSVGVYKGKPIVDLCALEDNNADVDMNIVANDKGNLIEVQGTAEGNTFSRSELNFLLDSALKAVKKINSAQKSALGTK
ncbi:MAG: ribonuclease PH [Elusimicrobia bacterium]|nr:ribonuclease PH [Elusimicrobiota bacterium]